MTESEKALMQRALDSLIESARLLDAMQEKKSSGIYTKTDSMFEGDFYEIIDVKKTNYFGSHRAASGVT